MKLFPSSQNREQDKEIVKLLKDLASFISGFPLDLFADKRTSFIAEVDPREADPEDQLLSKKQFIEQLEDLSSVKAAYPPELLAARRGAFIAQTEQLDAANTGKDA